MAKVCPNCELAYSDNEFFCAVDGSPLQSTGGDADNLVGTIIADRYRVESLIGEGGMGRVYRARHVRVPREAAIKVLRRALIADPYAVAAFNREARNAASVGDHPNVASVYDFGETSDGLVFLAMEFVEGETLSRRLEREPVLSPRRVVDIVRQIAAGLTAAHELPEPVVHRDLKPDNILLKTTRDGTDWVKVVDFGIAKAAKRDTQLLTTPGLVVGTPRYMSPEQLTGGTVDVRSDIYALGMIAFQMLTGRMPFASVSGDDESSVQWALQRLTLQPLALTQVRPDVQWPAAAQAALDQALATAATDRAPSAAAFARSLSHAFGLTTPSGVVGVLSETPGPVSSAVRAAAQSTAPTAPLAAAGAATEPALVPNTGQATRPLAAPPPEVVGAVPGTQSSPRGSSRMLVGVAGAVILVAGVAAFLWRRASNTEVAGPVTPAVSLAPAARPNDSATRASGATGSAPSPVGGASSQPASARAGDSTAQSAVNVPTTKSGSEKGALAPRDSGAAKANPVGATPDAGAVARARAALDRVKSALADPDAVAAAGTGPAIIRELRQLIPTMPTRSDSVEAIYYLIETNLVLDRPDEACRLAKRVRPRARGTTFLAGVDRYLADSDLGCASRR